MYFSSEGCLHCVQCLILVYGGWHTIVGHLPLPALWEQPVFWWPFVRWSHHHHHHHHEPGSAGSPIVSFFHLFWPSICGSVGINDTGFFTGQMHFLSPNQQCEKLKAWSPARPEKITTSIFHWTSEGNRLPNACIVRFHMDKEQTLYKDQKNPLSILGYLGFMSFTDAIRVVLICGNNFTWLLNLYCIYLWTRQWLHCWLHLVIVSTSWIQLYFNHCLLMA